MVKKLKNNTKKQIISTVARASNIVTIVTSSDHGYTTDTYAHIFAQDSSYDEAHTLVLSVPNSTTFTYANTGGDEGAKADNGSIGKTKFISKSRGWQVYPDAYFTIPDEEEPGWRGDPDIEADLSSGGGQELLFNDGTSDITDPDEGTDAFNAVDATCIKGVKVDDTAKADGKALVYKSASGKLEYQVPEVPVFGSQFASGESLGTSSTGSATYVQKLRLTTPSIPAGDYYIAWSGAQSSDKNTTEVHFRVQIDDSTTCFEVGRSMPSSNEFNPFSGFGKFTLGSGAHDIDLDHKTNTGSGVGSNVKSVRLVFWRVS